MALLPSIVFIIGGSIQAALSEHRSRTVQMFSAGLVLASVALLYMQMPQSLELALWRPTGLFGSGFVFAVDGSNWQFLLLGCGVVLAEALLGGSGARGLFYAAVAFAATIAGNLLTAVAFWTIMASLEAAERLRRDGGGELALLKLAAQAASIVLLIAAAYGGDHAHLLLAMALLLRAGGGLNSEGPHSLAAFPAIGAFSLASQSSLDLANLAWLWIAIAVALSVRSLFFGSRPAELAVALAAASLVSHQEVIWIAAAGLLVLSLGLLRTAGSRFTWISIAIFPLAFISSETSSWALGFLLTAVLTIAVRRLAGGAASWPLSRIQLGVLSILLGTTAIALVSSSISPGIGTLLIAGAGMAAGYGAAQLHPRLVGNRQRIEARSTYLRDLGMAVFGALGAAMRTIVNVLEGESAVLWILLALLMVVIGLQAAAA